MSDRLWAGIEAGGTKFVCGVARGATDILETETIPTTTPAETLARVSAFFRAAQARLGGVDALGVASFGPLDLDPASPNHGALKATPKPGWGGFNLKRALEEGLSLPVAIDTDVAGAGLAEASFGAGQGFDTTAYLTVGTGIGGALIDGGRPAHRHEHPEMGHITVRRRADDAVFAGVCPFHGDCVEGLASGPAVVARYDKRLSDMPPGAPIWAILADYLAQLCLSVRLIGAPERIIIGGGVMSNPGLYPLIQVEILRQNGGYIPDLATAEAVERFIVPPSLGDRAGLIGAMLLAAKARI